MTSANPRRRATRANPVSDENAVPTLPGLQRTRTATASGKDNLVGGLRARGNSTAAKAPLGDITKGNQNAAAGRKRAALGVVTDNDKNQIAGAKEAAKEKESGMKEPMKKKEKDVSSDGAGPGRGHVTKTSTARQRTALTNTTFTSTTTTTVVQSDSAQPLSRPSHTRSRSAAIVSNAPALQLEAVAEDADADDDDAMEVDPPEPAPAPIVAARPPVTRRASLRLSHIALPKKAPTATTTVAARQPLRLKTNTTTTGRPIAGNAALRKSKAVPTQPVAPPPDVDDEQDEGAPVKKRRTSSMDADELLEPAHGHTHAHRQVVVAKREVRRKTVQKQAGPVVKGGDMFAMQELAVKVEADAKTIAVAETEVEARPKDYGWEDLDACDEGDPLMVAEYAEEIFTYMQQCEIKTMPNPNYMDTQKELSWQMRGVLIDWLIELHAKFRMAPETLFLCVNVVDRFLSVRVVSLVKFQLVGVAAMSIAAKYEETLAPCVANYLACCDKDAGYDESMVIQAEGYILKSIGFDLSYPGPMSFLRRVSKAEEYDLKTRTVAKYLIEICCVDWKLIDVAPSLAAAAAIWLGRLIFREGAWNPNLIHYSGYTESELLPTAYKMVSYVLAASPAHENLHKKYAKKAYCKASVFVRNWALRQWPGRTAVGIEEVLAAQRRAEAKKKAEEM